MVQVHVAPPGKTPFTIYYGEVSGDSDGPVEFCWPVPSDQAAEIARFPDLTPWSLCLASLDVRKISYA